MCTPEYHYSAITSTKTEVKNLRSLCLGLKESISFVLNEALSALIVKMPR